MKKLNVKKGDLVEVLVGDQNEKGKRVKVLAAFPKDETVLLDGLFTAKKAVKPRSAQQTGGLIDKSRPIHVSNVMVVCPKCSKATRIGHMEVEGKSARVCRKCDAIIDVKVEAKGKKEQAKKTKTETANTEVKASKAKAAPKAEKDNKDNTVKAKTKSSAQAKPENK